MKGSLLYLNRLHFMCTFYGKCPEMVFVVSCDSAIELNWIELGLPVMNKNGQEISNFSTNVYKNH